MSSQSVFPVSLGLGKTKPDDLEFLEDTVSNLDDILKNGIQVGNRKYSVNLSHIVCDAPARALVKGIKQCTGYYGCDKCSQEGAWNGRVVYLETRDIELRTNDMFRDQTNAQHHHVQSPFCDLQSDMVKKFPSDYTTQRCLGRLRK